MDSLVLRPLSAPFVVGLSAVLAAGSLRAEPAPPTEVVVTGTRTPESSQRATVRTEVVTREEAEPRGARNVGEALAGEPSLEVNPQGVRPSTIDLFVHPSP